MKKHDVAFSCTAYEQIDENGKLLNKIIKTVPKADYNRDAFRLSGRKFYGYVQRRKRWGNLKYLILENETNDALWLRMLKKEKYNLWYEIGAYEISNKTEFYFK